VTPLISGNYTFAVGSDDGFQLYFNGSLLCQYWAVRSIAYTYCPWQILTAFVSYPVTLQYFQDLGLSQIEFDWILPGASTVSNIPFLQLSTTPCSSNSIYMTSGLIMSSAIGSVTMTVAPTSPPNGTIGIYLTSPCFLFSACVLYYNASTWTNQQTVTLFNLITPAPNGNQTCVVTAYTNGTATNYQGTTVNQTVSLINSVSSTSLNWGDPHLTTFDGVSYSNYLVGDYYFIYQTNANFVVQTRQTPCATASCNSAIAIKYGSVIFIVYINSNSGTPSTYLSGSPSANGVTITTSGSRYLFSASGGANVTVIINYWLAENLYYLTISATVLGTYQGQLYGLCGKYNGNSADDYTTSSGTLTTVVNTFVSSWQVVNTNQDMFITATPTIPTIFGGTSGGSTLVPINCSPTSATTGTDVTGLLSNVTDNAPPFANTTTPSFTSNTTLGNTTLAKQICSQYFNTSDATFCTSLGLGGNTYYTDCITDYALTGSTTFAIADASSYYSACQTLANSKNISYTPCPNLCNENGNCTNGTCTCNYPWIASDCSVNSTASPNTTAISPTNVGLGCSATTISVFGTGFVSSPLYCWFGNTPALATIINQYQVTCPAPAAVGNSPYTVSVIVKTASNSSLSTTGVTLRYTASCCQSPCKNGATCVPTSSNYTCTCPYGYYGTLCQNITNFCASNPCASWATCVPSAGYYNCTCPPFASGFTCKTFPTVSPSQCASISLEGACYEFATDSTNFCYNVTTGPYGPACNLSSLIIASTCNSQNSQLLSSSPAGAYYTSSDPSGLVGYKWNYNLEFSQTSFFCLEFVGMVDMAVVNFQASLKTSLDSTTEGPSC